jgi:small subunit ribosomal protein S1
MANDRDSESFASMFESAPAVRARKNYRVGEVFELEVVRVSPAAVFVALDGKREGFIQPEELANAEGKPTVSVGSRIAARVVDVDRRTGDVRLSPLSPEPLLESAEAGSSATLAPATPVVSGMRVKGKVVALERYGVFVEILVGEEPQKPRRGLIPARELGAPRGADLRKTFPLGTELEAVVQNVDERGRIGLSVVALRAADERKEFETYAAQGRERSGEPRPAQGFGTFADLMKSRRR